MENPGPYMPGWLGRPSEANFHVPKPPTRIWRSNLFDSRWSRRSCDISLSSPHKRPLFWSITTVHHSTGHTLPLTKGLGPLSCFPPFFSFLFLSKKNIQASFGNRQSCEPLNLFHINVGIIVMPADFIPLVGSSCQQHVPSSSILGTLKGLGPKRSSVPGASSSLLLADSRLCKIYNEYETCKMQYVRGGSCRTGWVWINVYWLENLLPWSRIGYPMCFQGGFGNFLLSMN